MSVQQKKENGKEISERVIRRLPRYYRFLGEMMQTGIERISSRELSEKMGLTASQIRQDLNCFGGFGQQGYGYKVAALHYEIGCILGQDVPKTAILIGAGNLGTAVAAYMENRTRGFVLEAVFDNNSNKFGQMVGGLPITDIASLEQHCMEKQIDAAILCVPKEGAKALLPRLVSCGISGILNFSHYDISMDYPQIPVENVHISDSLMTLRYKLQ